MMTDDWSLPLGGTTDKPPTVSDSASIPATYKQLLANSKANGTLKQYLQREGNILAGKYPFLTRHQIKRKAEQLWSQMSDAERQNYRVQTPKKKSVTTKLQKFQSPALKTGDAARSCRQTDESKSMPGTPRCCLASDDLQATALSPLRAATPGRSAVDSDITPACLPLAEAAGMGHMPATPPSEEKSPELQLRHPLKSKTYSVTSRSRASRWRQVIYKTPDVVEDEPTALQSGILKKDKEETKRPGARVSFSVENDSGPSSTDSTSSGWTAAHKKRQQEKDPASPMPEPLSFSSGIPDLAAYDSSGDSDVEKGFHLACLHTNPVVTRSKSKVKAKVTDPSPPRRRREQCKGSCQKPKKAKIPLITCYTSPKQHSPEKEQITDPYNFGGDDDDQGSPIHQESQSQDAETSQTSLSAHHSMRLQPKVQALAPVLPDSSLSVGSTNSSFKQPATGPCRAKVIPTQDKLQTPALAVLSQISHAKPVAAPEVPETRLLVQMKEAGKTPRNCKKTETESQQKRDRVWKSLDSAVASARKKARPGKAAKKMPGKNPRRKSKGKTSSSTKQLCPITKCNIQAMAQPRRISCHFQSPHPLGKETSKTPEERKSAQRRSGSAVKGRRTVPRHCGVTATLKKTNAWDMEQGRRLLSQESPVVNGEAMMEDGKAVDMKGDNFDEHTAQLLTELLPPSRPRLSFLERMRKRLYLTGTGKAFEKVEKDVNIPEKTPALLETVNGRDNLEPEVKAKKSLKKAPTVQIDVYELSVSSPPQCIPKKLNRSIQMLTEIEYAAVNGTCHSDFPLQTMDSGTLQSSSTFPESDLLTEGDPRVMSDTSVPDSSTFQTSDSESSDSDSGVPCEKTEASTALEQAIKSMRQVISRAAREGTVLSTHCMLDSLSSESPALPSSSKQSMLTSDSPLPLSTMLNGVFGRKSEEKDSGSDDESSDTGPTLLTVVAEIHHTPDDLNGHTSESEQESGKCPSDEGPHDLEDQGCAVVQCSKSNQQWERAERCSSEGETPNWQSTEHEVMYTLAPSTRKDVFKEQKHTIQPSSAGLCPLVSQHPQSAQGVLCDLFDFLLPTENQAQSSSRRADPESCSTQDTGAVATESDAIFM